MNRQWNDGIKNPPSVADFPIWVHRPDWTSPRMFYTDNKLVNFSHYQWSRAEAVPTPPEQPKKEFVITFVSVEEESVVATNEAEAIKIFKSVHGQVKITSIDEA